ncbi:C-type lectin domain family 1 member A [Alligator mississippiensis]|uniref:C-type lectin domain-containing protein n=1 Tax=Alligator mississippiensis TaxID=8496 RepID=A0A151MPA0_ALLMI|nr:C-type lectin domain family 1 member A [Alligator mississippiensis]KYO26358.1 hypothetical protein Y1Q_0022508 [Alligator mississippiensis]
MVKVQPSPDSDEEAVDAEPPPKEEGREKPPRKIDTLRDPPRKRIVMYGQDFVLPSKWRLVSLILGIGCLILFIGLVGLLGNYANISILRNKKMESHQDQNEKLKLAVKQLAAGRGSQCDPCLEDWIQRGDTCYFMTDELTTWAECVYICKKKGGRLAKLETQAKVMFFRIQMRQKFEIVDRFYLKYFRYWVGLAYNTLLRKWIWIDGSDFEQLVYSEKTKTYKTGCGLFLGMIFQMKECSLRYRCICEKIND